MTYYLYPRRHRAFIVEDEILIALDLEAEMNALGFNFCRLAPRANKACPLAMSDHPDIVLMDSTTRGPRMYRSRHTAPGRAWNTVVFLTSYTDEAIVERIGRHLLEAPILPKAAYRERLLMP